MGLKVVVVGGLGFIGSFVVRKLVEEGYEVVVVSRSSKGLWRLIDLFEDNAFALKFGNVLDYASIRKHFHRVDYVINMVALISHKIQGMTYKVNFNGTLNVFRAAHDEGVKKVIQTSVAQVYLPKRKKVVRSEDYKAPRSEYLAGKIGGELVAKKYSKKGLKSVILRPTIVIGPRSPHGLNALLLLSYLGLQPITFGNSSALMNPIYVEDLAKAYISSIEYGEGIFYIAGSTVVTLGDILNYASIKGRGVPTVAFMRNTELATALMRVIKNLASTINIDVSLPTERGVIDTLFVDNIYDPTKARDELGWWPSHTTFQAIEKTVNWYRESGLSSLPSAIRFIMEGKIWYNF